MFALRRAGLDFAEGDTFEGVPLATALNSTTNTVEGGIEFFLTPLTTLSVTASGQTDRFDSSPERNADTLRILPSIRMEAPAIIQGSLAVGYRRFSALDPDTPDYSGLVIRIAHAHVRRMDEDRPRALARRPILVRGDRAVPSINRIQGRSDAAAAGGLGRARDDGRDRLDYREEAASGVPNDTRTDRATVLGGGMGYRLQPNLRVGVDVEFAKRSSDRPDRRYDRTRVFASMTYGF